MSQVLLGLVSLPILSGLFLVLRAVRQWFRQSHLHDVPGPPRTSLIAGEWPFADSEPREYID